MAAAWFDSERGRRESFAKRARFAIPKILEIEKRTNHDVIAFLENVAASVGPAARWIHQGLNVIRYSGYDARGADE